MTTVNKSRERRHLSENRDKCIKDFINELSHLANAALAKYKNDGLFRRKYDEYNLAKKEAPEEVITMAGPPIWKYREDIANGNINKFLNSDFKDDIYEYSTKIPDADEFEEDNQLIMKIKSAWLLSTEAEQNMNLTRAKKLVALYATYIKISKELDELSQK